MIDRKYLKQALLNIINNGIAAMQMGGHSPFQSLLRMTNFLLQFRIQELAFLKSY